MASISKATFARVLMAVLLAVPALAGCNAKPMSQDKILEDYTKVSLAELNKSPRDFLGLKVCFEAYFIRQTDLYPTFPTPFTRTEYVNLSVWPRGALLWKADQMEKSCNSLYIARDSGGLVHRNAEAPLKRLEGLRKYQPIVVYGTVVQDTESTAWVVVDTFRTIEALAYSDETIRRMKVGDEHFAAKEFIMAAKDYRKALAMGLPTEVVGAARRNVGFCMLAMEMWAEAEADLKAAIQAGGGDAECLIGLAEALGELGKAAESEKYCHAALFKDPRSALARAELALALGRQKKFIAGREECEEALKLVPGSADVLRARGYVENLYSGALRGKERDLMLDRAIATYKAAVFSRPADPRIHEELGQLYVKKNDLVNAKVEYRNVVDAAGKTYRLRYCRGCCLLAGVLEALKEGKDAVEYYRMSQQRDEAYIPAYMGLGALLCSGGMYDDALAQFRAVAERLDPAGDDGFKALRSMAAIHDSQAAKDPANIKEAADCYERAAKIKPKHYDNWMDLALTRWRQAKPDRKAALTALAECVKLKPDQARPHYLRGSILMELKDYVAASQELVTAKRLDEKNPRVLLALGITYRELDNASSALQEFRAADKLEVKDEALKLDIRNSLAYALADLSRGPGPEVTEAEKLANQVVSAKGGVVAYLDTLGWAQAKAGKLPGAAKTLEEAAGKAAEGNAEVYYHLGFVYAGLKKHAEAITALDTAKARLAKAGDKHPRAVRMENAVKTLLAQQESEKARLEGGKRR